MRPKISGSWVTVENNCTYFTKRLIVVASHEEGEEDR
jgi:hypothetical protein